MTLGYKPHGPAATTWNTATAIRYAFSGGDLTATNAEDFQENSAVSTRGLSTGKAYFELLVVLAGGGEDEIGLANSSASMEIWPGVSSTSVGWNSFGGITSDNYDTFLPAPSYGTGDVLQFALDRTSGLFFVGTNGTFQGDPVAGTGGFTLPSGEIFAKIFTRGTYTASSVIFTANFGATSFAHTPPSGYPAWNAAA